MNPTPQDLWIFFADAIQDTVGYARSVQPKQIPLTDNEMQMIETIIKSQFDLWRKNGKRTGK